VTGSPYVTFKIRIASSRCCLSALFGKTAKEWRTENSDVKGNIRDVATIQQLIVLSNMESMNAELIKRGVVQKERLVILNKMAIEQMTSILGNMTIKKLK
jgi:hypothetical protein